MTKKRFDGRGAIYAPWRSWLGLVCLGMGLALIAPRPGEAWQAAEPAPPADPAAPAEQPVAPPAAPPAKDVPAEDVPAQDAPAPDGAPKPPDGRAERFIGRVITIPAPITDRVEMQVQREATRVIEDAKKQGGQVWPVLIFEFQNGANELGKSYDLANFLSGPALAGATTVAYLPGDLEGHAVLAVLACDQIAMHPDARIGAAGSSEQAIGPAELNLYKGIADRRKTMPVAVALGLLDSRLEVLEVETELSREYVLADELTELEKTRAIQSKRVLFRAGEPHYLTAAEGSKLGFVARLAQNKEQLAKAYGLSRESLQDDPRAGGEWRAARIAVEGPINDEKVAQIERSIDDAIRLRDANLICLVIDSPGGSPAASLGLANYLADLNPAQRRTVAYIAREARGDAAAVALGCDEIVMRPQAILGGVGAYALADRAEIDDTLKAAGELARRKFRNPALAGALIAPQAAVYRYTNKATGLTEFFTETEAAALPDADQWERGAAGNKPGEVLQVVGSDALDLGLASHTVDDFNGFKRLYGLENDPELVEPGWAHFLIDALKSPALAWMLLVVGGAALWAELHSPGMGIGAFVALVCFLLFFWSRYLGGTAGWLEAVLFLAGLICVLLEIFVLPGFGVFGLGGSLMILASLVLASQTFVWPRNEYQVSQMSQSLTVVVGAMAAIVVLAFVMRRFLPHTPVFNQMLLAPPAGQERDTIERREALAHYEHLIGERGLTTTPLMPSGKARFGSEMVDVLSDGELIAVGTPVEIVSVQGNRVLVRAVA